MISDSVVNQNGWIGITVVLFVAGIGIGYGVFSSSQLMPSTMMGGSMDSFMNNPQAMMQNPEFMQAMMQNPEFMQAMMQNQQMMDNTMNSGMMMGSSPIEQHERMIELVEMMRDDENMMNHLFAHMIENELMVHQMFSLMDSSSALKEHMAAHVSGDLSEYEHLDDMHDKEEHGHEDERQ